MFYRCGNIKCVVSLDGVKLGRCVLQEHERARADGLDPLDLDNKEEVSMPHQQPPNGQANNYGAIPNGQGVNKEDGRSSLGILPLPNSLFIHS